LNRQQLPLPPYPAPGLVPPAPSAWRRLTGWLRFELAPSSFRRSWRPRLSIVLVLVAITLLVWRGRFLAGWLQLALWATLVVVVAFLSRGGWFQLFGPVLFYDLVRAARRGRMFLLRSVYALALLVVLFLVYAIFLHSGSSMALFSETRLNTQQLAEFGSGFFLTFVGVQFAAVFLLTPVFTATAITEEKQRKTLEYLLATDLHNREIVLSKLLSRLLVLLLLLLGGLPVLSFVQFLGGVDPNLVVAGFVATVASMLSLGSLGICYSVYSERARNAIVSTYATAGAYLLLSSCLGSFALWSAGSKNPLGWPAAGNIFIAYARIAYAASTTGNVVLLVLGQYVGFHVAVTLILATLATLKLRSWNREWRPKSEREAVMVRRLPQSNNPLALPPRLPAVSGDPILWKELYVEHGPRLPGLARGAMIFLAACFLFLAGFFYLCGLAVSLVHHESVRFVSTWVRVVGTAVGCYMIVAVGVRASSVLSGERDRQTLDSLLTTPLTSAAILRGKWLGALFSARQAGWCLVAVWMLGLCGGGLHLLSLIMLAATWWAYGAFAAGLGLWFSLRCATTFRATAWTLVTLLVAGGLPVLVCGAAAPGPLLEMFSRRPITVDDLLALTPPGAMVYLTFGWGNWYTFEPAMASSLGRVALAWAGVCIYGLAAVGLWFAVRARFSAITGRMPDGSGPHPFSRRPRGGR
jgi:ABC-type transport system involved in multi-copper enzyme maturation permease subunit